MEKVLSSAIDTIIWTVSSMVISVLSTSTASGAGFKGADVRVESRRSRTCMSLRTSERHTRLPFCAKSFCRRIALWAESAVRKILRSAWGRITVPISRPSMTTSQACAISFWVFTRCARTAGIAEVMDAMEETSSVRSRPVTFFLLR